MSKDLAANQIVAEWRERKAPVLARLKQSLIIDDSEHLLKSATTDAISSVQNM